MGYKIDSNTLQVGKELEDKLAQLGLVIITDPDEKEENTEEDDK